MGAVLREQNALPTRLSIALYLTAKDAIDNGGAGRAAKGARPVASTKKCKAPFGVLHFFCFPTKRRDLEFQKLGANIVKNS